MSVINKMLRDLDKRHSEPSAERQHTVSVAQTARARQPKRKSMVPIAALVVVLVMAGGAWWGWQQMQMADAPPMRPSSSVTTAATIATAPVSASQAVAAAIPVAPEVSTPIPAAPAAQPAVPASKPALAASALPAAPASKPVLVASTPLLSPMPPLAVAPVGTDLKIETSLKLTRAAKEAPSTTTTPVAQAASSAQPVPPGQRLLQAGRDAQVQAQALWNSGAKEAAMELLQQAVGNMERSLASEPVAGQISILSSLVRDLTRMQLADGRAGEAWDLLVRLESSLRNDADLWAVRGNAAQRLGRHQDSAHAYLAALQFRPNEQRWLLGAAVSLAASGQIAAAADMAEKARAVGSISPEVQAYLRQAGVPLKDK